VTIACYSQKVKWSVLNVMRRSKKGKFYKYVDEKTVRSFVSTITGVKCYVPPELVNMIVQVTFHFDDHCDFIYSRVMEKSDGTFVPIPSMYVANYAYIRID
jgi:hypothetical protein